MDTEKNMTELQKRALEIVDQYEGLTLQGKIYLTALHTFTGGRFLL